MKTNVQSSTPILTYLPNERVHINLDNILTRNQIVHPEMLLLKIEGRHVDVIKVKKIEDRDGYLYIMIEDQITGRVNNLIQILDHENKFFLWWVVSYEYVMNDLENRVCERLTNKGALLEFDFKPPIDNKFKF